MISSLLAFCSVQKDLQNTLCNPLFLAIPLNSLIHKNHGRNKGLKSPKEYIREISGLEICSEYLLFLALLSPHFFPGLFLEPIAFGNGLSIYIDIIIFIYRKAPPCNHLHC